MLHLAARSSSLLLVIAPKDATSIYMEIYRSVPQKSSDLAQSSLNPSRGLTRSVAAWAVIAGMTAHLRIYEAALRLGMEKMFFSAAELCAWMGENGIHISMATAQRALVDTRFFRLSSLRRTGKKGRPCKIYKMVKPDKIGDMLGLEMDASWEASEFDTLDLSSAHRYKVALLARVMIWMDTSTRQQQMDFWGWSKPTLIRWTREVCEITPQFKRIPSDNLNFTAPVNGEEVFLHEVSQREYPRDRRYWLEVVTSDGEIRKLPCTVDMAALWLPLSVVTICEQLPNQYRVRDTYRDTPIWQRGELLPY